MISVEQGNTGFQWGEPLTKSSRLEVTRENDCLRVSGLLPLYADKSGWPCDLLRQYEMARHDWSKGPTSKNSPHIRFANASTDERLIHFVQDFGPVVARKTLLESGWPPRLIAEQDMNELRNERLLYRSALTLIMELAQPEPDASVIQGCIAEIANKLADWPRQWERERRLRQQSQILWKISPESLRRIQQLSAVLQPDPLLPRGVDGRIVICELLNAFRGVVFPNRLEFHSSIRYGIRPLLYSILRREFLYPRDIAVCANTQCREFFEVQRAGQRFCCDSCSLHQRQRDYWKAAGKKLRDKRLRAQKKLKRTNARKGTQ